MTNPPPSVPPIKPRPRFRISIRALIVLVLVIGGGLGWIVHRAKVKRDAVAAISRFGGVVHYDWEFHNGSYDAQAKCPWPKWLVDAIGIDSLSSVTQVQIGSFGPPLTTQSLRAIGKLTTLEELWIEGGDITEADLAPLENLSRLKHLEMILFRVKGPWIRSIAKLSTLEQLQVGFPIVTDEDLGVFSRLGRLKSLQLHIQDGSKITDAGLAQLAGLHELRVLQLDRYEITTEGLKHLRWMTQLESLTLASSPNFTSLEPLRSLVQLQTIDVHGSPRIDDAGIAVLSDLPMLQSLNLDGTQVSDLGLWTLRNLRNLEFLYLPKGVTDGGLDALKEVKSLKFLALSKNTVTSKQIEAVKAAHPGLQVWER